jgi:hypothetical protein
LTGPASASQSLELKKPGNFKPCQFRLASAAASHAGVVPL